MTLLADKTAIITGASSGIGRAAALLFAAQGASLVLVARRKERLEALVEDIVAAGGSAVAMTGDVTDAATHEAAVAAAQTRFGGLHIAFNNAGLVGPMQPLAMIDPTDWQAVLATNLTAAFLGARAQIPAMLASGGGALVFTGSFVGASVGLPGMSAYAAAKAGLLGLVRGITADYAAAGIRANALLPGGTATEMAGDDTQREWAAGLHAMKRIADPDEIAQAALFLASDMASFVTGSSLWADGGNAAVKL
ncbi:SDR family NAD(P)-dependent oxidoreductase [Sphingomonas sp. ABOLD]|uniref:NAD(P)-dependent dehydrogenase (Short-subunit alcohol dehydrogenase family) n=1 Tax=Sphingomonas trueperi TaxID=53317 RepID=A0A7X6BB61_9SPHN|nr:MULTISPECIES: SDR family oxidoreductase [Sphingomonas]NJB96709.1 NAD(P)-dependent dehydrogenase (short-subunit alcohol dehydrogenase family) [Sphingomonas trueperi]RSV34480.1 SDR family NAD(P)-dependent oxidoreductase [Sphingomonas sp. ABOLE]RSV51998.1 SDR family NAD(P)-dependent oxidoreductase [Sphingomonas sp. ABOLD]